MGEVEALEKIPALFSSRAAKHEEEARSVKAPPPLGPSGRVCAPSIVVPATPLASLLVGGGVSPPTAMEPTSALVHRETDSQLHELDLELNLALCRAEEAEEARDEATIAEDMVAESATSASGRLRLFVAN
ncbi:hypothetical protein BHE74_00018833 [Ensete ventricosum]|nr:hypothetical protein BHE74_00018833 [Ensete ventricosum]